MVALCIHTVDDMAEVTKEEVVEIVTSFLLNSPPGEFMEVVTGMCLSDFFCFIFVDIY